MKAQMKGRELELVAETLAEAAFLKDLWVTGGQRLAWTSWNGRDSLIVMIPKELEEEKEAA